MVRIFANIFVEKVHCSRLLPNEMNLSPNNVAALFLVFFFFSEANRTLTPPHRTHMRTALYINFAIMPAWGFPVTRLYFEFPLPLLCSLAKHAPFPHTQIRPPLPHAPQHLIASGCQVWNKNVLDTCGDRFAYCSTLSAYVHSLPHGDLDQIVASIDRTITGMRAEEYLTELVSVYHTTCLLWCTHISTRLHIVDTFRTTLGISALCHVSDLLSRT